MDLNKRIEILSTLGKKLNENQDAISEVKKQAKAFNPWFTDASIDQSLNAIISHFLDKSQLEAFISKYNCSVNEPKTIGIIMAGNIPMVGFHDMMCVFLSGHKSMVKLSEKDTVLISFLIELLNKISPESVDYFTIVNQLKGFDAVIATGSNNTSTYFKKYFQPYPHIIRQNRNGIAILSGNETRQELYDLGKDIFTYFGLGCRNVSKIYVPDEYDFVPLLEELHKYNDLIHHHKYKNNFDYNLALFMLNRAKYFNNGSITLVESDHIASRIASCHYSYYKSIDEVVSTLNKKHDQIQCIVSTIEDLPLRTFPFGEAQSPAIDDFADGIDTMKFLETI